MNGCSPVDVGTPYLIRMSTSETPRAQPEQASKPQLPEYQAYKRTEKNTEVLHKSVQTKSIISTADPNEVLEGQAGENYKHSMYTYCNAVAQAATSGSRYIFIFR